MSLWLDLALIGDEAQLLSAIEAMSEEERNKALESLADQLGVTSKELVNGVIRLLIERVRPLALPRRLWTRSNTSSDDPRAMIRDHFVRNRIAATPERVAAADSLYTRFLDERDDVRVGLAELEDCGFRCARCGMAFCNDQLEAKAIVSPFGNRRRDKRDERKPHWNNAVSYRQPTRDHVWPVSTYGDNASVNLQVLCRGCNVGKENYMAVQQTKAWTGLVGRSMLLNGQMIVDWAVFHAQLCEEPRCEFTGQGPDVTELTVKLIDPEGLPVLGNLRTAESPGL